MSYKLQTMTDERAKMILDDLLAQLSEMDPRDMTTFELQLLHRCASNPPSQRIGIESNRE